MVMSFNLGDEFANLLRPQVLTKDSVTVVVDGVCYYSIDDPLKVANSIKDYG